ncbi:MAG: hypothetical protein ACRD96_17220 [Bryobacteraceae bacterium]
MNCKRFLSALLLTALLSAAGFKGAAYKIRRAGKPTQEKSRQAVSQTLEITVTSDQSFPIRALDPVLHIGDVEIREYRYFGEENKALIFTWHESDKLEEGAIVFLQYDYDTRTRTDLPPFKRSMIE